MKMSDDHSDAGDHILKMQAITRPLDQTIYVQRIKNLAKTHIH